MTDDERAERMKTVADELGFDTLRGTRFHGATSWVVITVAHATLLSESPDGWDVKITRSGL